MIEPQHRSPSGTYYTREGDGPALVVIDGEGGNAAVWFQQVEVLARDHSPSAKGRAGRSSDILCIAHDD
jgi:hypothetical protein